ncbi:MAG: Prolipoprotein diacylglyceryl transferase, partial [Acidobacteria bacterium]|nr:Prolipoprotein diacylglyceryl transferase [Acidobacteriota bacterium]
MLASIPSPSFNTFDLGPLTIHIYGILMGIAVATAFVLVTYRFEKLGGDRKVAESAGFWCIVIGFIGARAAYVLPRLGQPHDHWWWVFQIWEGGIALFGGLTLGLLTAIFVVRRRGGSFWMFADAAAIALPAAQAIGRWGNYFNQELFGTPTTLPW